MNNKKLYLNLLLLLLKCCNLPFAIAAYAYSAGHQPYLHSQCQGLNSVYDNDGNLSGYRGVCDVNKYDGNNPSINSMHAIDTKLLSDSIHDPRSINARSNSSWSRGLTADSSSHKIEPSIENSFFDWLTPHHDIIRNHSHYRKAHFQHRHCINKKKSGLFDFIGRLFDSEKKPNFEDPYINLDKKSRCLNPEYYNVEANNFDPFAIGMGHNIQNLRNQIRNLTDSNEIELMKNRLHNHFDSLHRHLDCHCHHELSDSKLHRVHHYPIKDHSIQTLSYPDTYNDSLYPSQMSSTLPIDPSIDLEDEHMALMRMSGLASQQAYNHNQFNPNSLTDTGTLRMQMFHPVNSYAQMNTDQTNDDDSDWNRLRVEKIIVIKRLKVPIVKNIPVPVPVPVPFLVPSSMNNNLENSTGFYNGGGSSELYSIPQGYMGNNTYMVDSEDSSTNGMDSIVNAISGAPCSCLNQKDRNYGYNQQPQLNWNRAHYENIQTQPFYSNQIGQEYPHFQSINNGNYTDLNSLRQVPPSFMPHIAMQPGLQLTLPPAYNINNQAMSMPQSNAGLSTYNDANNKNMQVSSQNNINSLLQQPASANNVPQTLPGAQNNSQINFQPQQIVPNQTNL